MKNIRWLQLGRSERGSGQVMFSLALVAVAGGVATYMTNNDERAVQSAAIQKSRDASQQANMTNMSAIGALLRFPSNVPQAQQVATNPAFLPSVYPDPYIYGSNPASVKLGAIINPGSAARWSSNGQGEISVEGFNSGKLNDSAMDQVFENGGQLQLTGTTQTGDSRVRMLQVVETGPNASIVKVRVVSLASVTNGNNQQYNDQIEADVAVPLPPKPEVTFEGLPEAPLSFGQTATLRLRGYGLMTSVQVASNGSNPATNCTPAIPEAAKSIRNTATGGFSLGSCTFAYNPVNLTPSNNDPAKGFFDVKITATGPGGVSTATARVYAWNPPSCSFNPTSYSTSQGGGASIRMVTGNGGPLSSAPQMQMPVNGRGSVNGWHQVGRWVATSGAGPNTWTGYFAPGYEHGQAYIEGRVTGPGIAPGTWQTCNNIAWVNVNQTVCYEHTQARWYYLGQCYRVTGSHYMRWFAYGPQYQRCRGQYFNNPWCAWRDDGIRDGGCFATGTAIKMGDGSTRPVEDIHNGDLVFNPLTGGATKVRGKIRGPEKEPLIEVGYDGKVVRVTTKHPMLTSKGIRPAMELHLGDDVLGADRKYHRLTEVRRLPVDPDQQVYNFILDDPNDSPSHHVVVADGILTGDLQMQQELEKANKSLGKVAKD